MRHRPGASTHWATYQKTRLVRSDPGSAVVVRHPPSQIIRLLLPPLAAIGCSEANFEPVDAQSLNPPDVYRVWWTEVESCTQMEGTFSRVDWYSVERIEDREAGVRRAGAWQPPHTIYLQHERANDQRVVKHEIVHDLLQRRDHDTPLFKDCARY